MHQSNTILIQASPEQVFRAAAELERWPHFLPHYRYIHYLQRGRAEADGKTRHVVKMAARRGKIPVSWVSEQIIVPATREVHFRHLQAWTEGMRVVWLLTEVPAGVQVSIVHDLQFKLPALAPLAEPVIGKFFIDHIATQTLKHMKAHVERS